MSRPHLDSRPNRAPDACDGKRKPTAGFLHCDKRFICNCTDAAQVATDRDRQKDGRMDGRTDLASLICIGERAKQLASAERLPFCSLASPASGIWRQNLMQMHNFAGARARADRELIPVICKWVPPQNSINGVHFR